MTSPGYRPESSLIPATPGITPLNDLNNAPFHQLVPEVFEVSPPAGSFGSQGGSGGRVNSDRPDLPDWHPAPGTASTDNPGYRPEQALIPTTPPVKAAFPGRQASPSVPQSQLPPLNRAQGV